MEALRVAVISPSGTIEQRFIDQAIDKAKSLSLDVVLTTNHRLGPQPFLNGTKHERLNELICAERSEALAIWCARGGCGAVELWHDYQEGIYQDRCAPLIGYSDITIYHFMRYYRAGRIGIHGPLFLDLLKSEVSLEPIEILLKKKAEKLIYPALKSLNHFLTGFIEGPLIPMNLASLQSIIGCFDPKFFQGKILGIEDVNEPPYKVFRALLQLKNAGILAGLKALLLGHFSEGRSQIISHAIMLMDELGIPLFDWPVFGHDQPNWPLLFGAKTSIRKVDEPFFTLNYDEQYDHIPIERA